MHPDPCLSVLASPGFGACGGFPGSGRFLEALFLEHASEIQPSVDPLRINRDARPTSPFTVGHPSFSGC